MHTIFTLLITHLCIIHRSRFSIWIGTNQCESCSSSFLRLHQNALQWKMTNNLLNQICTIYIVHIDNNICANIIHFNCSTPNYNHQQVNLSIRLDQLPHSILFVSNEFTMHLFWICREIFVQNKSNAKRIKYKIIKFMYWIWNAIAQKSCNIVRKLKTAH